ncbi:hypothetical protein OG394_28755 [Kribbella sp. NBC_01245]|uniref:hypothetical protein n=1 Tax=Kribbella sp. NBC_01245 TaxID=2903578 RepID=UPI002E2B305B|nr:hypothetical protein [Kribbella sp. NBC_01245]
MSVQRPPARDESVNPARPEMIYGPTQEPQPEAQANPQQAQAAPQPPSASPPPQEPKAERNNLAIAGAGGILAILAFVAGTAVGHAWEPTPATQTGGPGGIQIGPGGVPPNGVPPNGVQPNGGQQNGGQPNGQQNGGQPNQGPGQ